MAREKPYADKSFLYDTKRCGGCKEILPKSQFGKNRGREDGLQSQCKECCNAASTRWRQNNLEKSRGWTLEARKKATAENRERLLEYLLSHPCVECGEADPIVLEFDHINPEEKEKSISALVRSRKWESVMQEIEKCQVLCANCHKRRTAKQFGWWKSDA